MEDRNTINEKVCALFRSNDPTKQKEAFDICKQYESKVPDWLDVKVHLGCCYFLGIGTERNNELAFKYFKYASEQNNDVALNNLGIMYKKGIHVTKNQEEGFRLIKLSADIGYATGISNLAEFYHQGEVVSQDTEKAIELFEQALNLDDEDTFCIDQLMSVYETQLEKNKYSDDVKLKKIQRVLQLYRRCLKIDSIDVFASYLDSDGNIKNINSLETFKNDMVMKRNVFMILHANDIDKLIHEQETKLVELLEYQQRNPVCSNDEYLDKYIDGSKIEVDI